MPMRQPCSGFHSIAGPPVIEASRLKHAGASRKTAWRSVIWKSCTMTPRGMSMSSARMTLPRRSTMWRRRNGGIGEYAEEDHVAGLGSIFGCAVMAPGRPPSKS